MPNAAATFDDDFGFDRPARKAAPRKARTAPAKKKRKRPGAGLDMRKVARVSAVAMSAIIALGIMVNALILQKSRHPAPLFGKTVAFAAAPARPAPVESAKAPAPSQAAAPAVAPEPVAPPVPAARPRHAAAEKAGGDDAIARLLQGSGATAPSQADKPDSKTVLGVQKALAKLGFAVKPNGALGPSTRKAIEAFEKDRHLPIKAELSHRLVKIIGAESGVKID